LGNNFIELQEQGYIFTFDSKKPNNHVNKNTYLCPEESPPESFKMPHPVREIAKGRPTFTIGLMSWADDVSGNSSKQYNAHTNVYSANINLPHRKLQQEYFVRFSSTSPTASALEQLDASADDTGANNWHEAYDCLYQQEILFRMINRVEPADNPQQSELCSHIGLHGNKFCRRCHVGGTGKELETQSRYESLYTVLCICIYLIINLSYQIEWFSTYQFRDYCRN
jgi:hypothetical protein